MNDIRKETININVTAVPNDEKRKKCCALVKDQVCMQVDIKIDPKINVGEIKMVCQEPTLGKCCRVPCSCEPCEFSVSQIICVEVPLFFSAETLVNPAGHICRTPELGPCNICT